jgi:hypothetical protein
MASYGKESRDGGLVPEVKRLLEQPPIAGCGEEMSAKSKRSVDRLEHPEKTLSVLWRLKALHLSFSHAGWLMRVLVNCSDNGSAGVPHQVKSASSLQHSSVACP